jgi:hypothetical protein
LWLPLALRYQDLSPEGLQLDLEFIDHVFKLVFINELDWSDAISLSFQLG